MKRMIMGVLVVSALYLPTVQANSNRLSKKDKQDLVAMFTEFIDGMERNHADVSVKEQMQSRWWFWESPMTRIEQSIDQLSNIAHQIQNHIYEINHYNNGWDKDSHARLAQIELLVAKLVALLADEKDVLGNLDDQSAGEQDFNSVDDIDNAKLSLISWLKTIYREQLKDKFIS